MDWLSRGGTISPPTPHPCQAVAPHPGLASNVPWISPSGQRHPAGARPCRVLPPLRILYHLVLAWLAGQQALGQLAKCGGVHSALGPAQDIVVVNLAVVPPLNF